MMHERRRLTVVDRTTIEIRLRDGWGVRAIARALGRSAGTVCDEVNRHGGGANYRAAAAEDKARASRLLTGRQPRLGRGGAVFEAVAGLLRLGWSPEQIAGRRKRIENGVEQKSGQAVSHEAIYAAIYALASKNTRR